MIHEEPPLSASNSTKSVTVARKLGRRRCGEVVGSGTAECAAICCCCPCGVMELLVLGFYKVPAGLCKMALRKQKKQRVLKKRKKQGLSGENKGPNRKEVDAEVDRTTVNGEVCFPAVAEAVDWEKEMMEKFPGGTGFWRSSSAASL